MTDFQKPQSSGEIIDYFLSLERMAFNLDINKFETFWNAIEEFEFSKKQLNIIINRTAKKFKALRQYQARQLHQFLCDDKAINIWIDKITPPLENADPHDCANILWSLSKLRIQPDLNLLQLVLDKSYELLPVFNGQDIAVTLSGFATLAIYPGNEYMELCESRIREILPNIKLLNLTTIAWSSAFFSSFDPSADLKELTNLILAQTTNFEDIDQSIKSQIDLAALWFELHKYRQLSPPHREQSSALEENFKKALNRVNIKLDNSVDHFIPELWRKTDFRLTYEGRDIMIETDGLQHFIYDLEAKAFYFDGSTHFQNAVLERIYPESTVIRLREPDNRALGVDAIARSLKTLFNTIRPGIYVSSLKNDVLSLEKIEYGPTPA